MAVSFIQFIEPHIDYTKTKPAWWPKSVIFKGPSEFSDDERNKFLWSVLCGEFLLMATTESLILLTKSSWEKMNPGSDEYSSLARLISAFDYRRDVLFHKIITQHQVPALQPGAVRPIPIRTLPLARDPVRRIRSEKSSQQNSNVEYFFDFNPHFCMLKVDLTKEFWLVWSDLLQQNPKIQGRLTWISSRVTMKNGVATPSDSEGYRIPSLLQDPLATKIILNDGRVGGIRFLIGKRKSSYIAFTFATTQLQCIPLWADQYASAIAQHHRAYTSSELFREK